VATTVRNRDSSNSRDLVVTVASTIVVSM